MSQSCLVGRKCVPCTGGVPPLKGEQIAELLTQLGSDWRVIDGHHLEKGYRFKNFREALAFTNRVGEVSERESHHPEIRLSWGSVTLLIWTHKVDGLTESDFVLAAKADGVL